MIFVSQQLFRPLMAFIFYVLLLSGQSSVYASNDLISLFPMDKYDQSVRTWINPNDSDYETILLDQSIQSKRMEIFYDHYFGSQSPWNSHYINTIIRSPEPNTIKSLEQVIIQYFSNTGKTNDQIGYGENFRPYSSDWINSISDNVNIVQFDNLVYQDNKRGIAIDNLHARALPTDDVHYYSHTLAGQGYPFDNLQMSSLWAGTPVYILAETKNHAWYLVVTPDYIGWVKSTGIAYVDAAFVHTWTLAAKNQLAAITQTNSEVVDDQDHFIFSVYVGSVFPAVESTTMIKIMVPVMNMDHQAVIKLANVSQQQASIMPLSVTPHHFSNVLSTLLGRPYGWGNMYFYNDCSAELKNALTPFGIWLPRHSSDQVTVGKMVDMSAHDAQQRLDYLMAHGKKFLTLVYIGGHIIMYIGTHTNPYEQQSKMVMTYQNMWGLSPTPSTRRAIVGKSVIFPMLLSYPEDVTLHSLADKKYFQVSYLSDFSDGYNNKTQPTMNVRSLIYPDSLFP